MKRCHENAGRRPGEPSLAHGDSFLSGRHAHHPTDIDIHRDATIAALRIARGHSAARDPTFRRQRRRRTDNIRAAFS